MKTQGESGKGCLPRRREDGGERGADSGTFTISRRLRQKNSDPSLMGDGPEVNPRTVGFARPPPREKRGARRGANTQGRRLGAQCLGAPGPTASPRVRNGDGSVPRRLDLGAEETRVEPADFKDAATSTCTHPRSPACAYIHPHVPTRATERRNPTIM